MVILVLIVVLVLVILVKIIMIIINHKAHIHEKVLVDLESP